MLLREERAVMAPGAENRIDEMAAGRARDDTDENRENCSSRRASLFLSSSPNPCGVHYFIAFSEDDAYP